MAMTNEPVGTEAVDEMKEYATSLGFFVMQFAETEQAINVALVMLSGTDWPTSRVLFSGVRVDVGKAMIDRFLDIKGFDSKSVERTRIKEAFAQLTLISNVRNDLLHYGLKHDDALGMVATNRTAVHLAEKARAEPVSREILFQMRADLSQINWIITTFTAVLMGVPLPTQFQDAGMRPWLYKPAPQRPKAPSRRKAPQAPAPRRPS